MKKTLAVAAAILSLSFGLPAAAQTMERHSTTVTTPDGRTMTKTVVRDGDRDGDMRDGDRTVVRRTVVRHDRRDWGRDHHRRCVTRWNHHRRVTRCWSR